MYNWNLFYMLGYYKKYLRKLIRSFCVEDMKVFDIDRNYVVVKKLNEVVKYQVIDLKNKK